MGEPCENLFADKYPIPPVILHLLRDGDKLARTLEQGGERQSVTDALPAGGANAVAFSVRAVIAPNESEFNEAVDVPAECPFVDSANALTDGIVRRKNRFTMARLQKTEHGLKCL